MARIDYYDDPTAPAANSVVPSVPAAVRDGAGRLLLIHKIDNGYWALPGGAMDLGESIRDAAVREVLAETGVSVEVTGLVGIYTDPGHVMAYDDGEVRQEFSVLPRPPRQWRAAPGRRRDQGGQVGRPRRRGRPVDSSDPATSH